MQQGGFPTTTRAGLIATAATGQQNVATLTGTPYAGPGLGGNLVQNGDFSNGSAGWTLVAGDVVDTVPADAPPGSSTCLKKVAVGRLANTTVIPVLPNTTYTLGGWLRSDGTNTAFLRANALTAGGALVSQPTVTTTNSTWTYVSGPFVTGGNITTLQVSCFTTVAATTYYGQVCIAQGSLTAAQLQAQFASNPLGNTSLVACEATTNLLTDGDCEGVGGTTTSVLFNDPLANANAWTGAPSVSANVLTATASTDTIAGHPDWWDTQDGSGTSTSQLRFQPQTGFSTLRFYVGYQDATHNLSAVLDGTNLSIAQNDNGATTTIGAGVACALVAGTNYWLTWSRTGTSLTFTVKADGATPGATIATISATITATTWNTWGKVGVSSSGAALLLGQMGGTAYAGVCQVSGPKPAAWHFSSTGSADDATNTAFCWSKAQTFNGTYSLSMVCALLVGYCFWNVNNTYLAAPYANSARVKVVSLATGGFVNVQGSGSVSSSANIPVGDWTLASTTWTSTGGGSDARYRVTSASAGQSLAYFDCAMLEQKAYSTNLDPFPAFYVPTGARAAAYVASIPAPVSLLDPSHAWTLAVTVQIGVPLTSVVGSAKFLGSFGWFMDASSGGRIGTYLNGAQVGSKSGIVTGTYRLVNTCNGAGSVAFWVNGVLVGASVLSFSAAGALSIGNGLSNSLAGLTIANHAWSAAEVAADFANSNPPGLIVGGGQYLQPGMLYAQTPDATGNSLALPPPTGGRVVQDVAHVGVVRAGSLQPLAGQSTVGVQGAVFDAAGLLQAGGLKHISATVGTSQVAVAHGLGRVPSIILFFERSNATSWQSATADATNVYLTASVAGTSVDLYVA